ncbi:MAG: hypothetical protein COB02_11670 [Candidatus Cloacimonadota bacterium]|nr:MAG: hypothetical protein COB02_11670 [Candidatus Cloacimonadota bacterium]
MKVKNLSKSLLIFALLLCGCDKKDEINNTDIPNEQSTRDSSISSQEPVNIVEPSIETTNNQVESDVIAQATSFLQNHDSPSSTNNNETPQVTSTTRQCGSNGEFFEGIETDNNCNEETTNNETTLNTNTNGVAFCYFNKSTIRGSYLKTSKWGAIGHIQRALNIKVDGIFGATTKVNLIANLKVDNFQCLSNQQYQNITKLTPENYKKKAENFSYMMEGTDYDDLEFNYGHDDDDPSGATWGPTGMTLRDGEISKILKLALPNDDVILALDKQEVSLLTLLSTKSGSQAKSLIRREVWNKGKSARNQMKALFKKLASIKSVRKAFDTVSAESIQHKLKHYEAFLQKHQNVSEIDWAMFYDISIQTGKPQTKAKALMNLAPPGKYQDTEKRRRAWAEIIANQVSSRWKKDRLERSLLFVGKDSLARAFGLSDNKI